MTAPRKHADPAVRYFLDNTTNCWARNEGSNNEWTLMPDPRFNVPGLEYHVGHEPPPPVKRTINLPAAAIELRPGEHYAGLVLADNGHPLHHLVLMAARPDKRLSWEGAMDWAAEVGGALPTRREQSLLFAHCHEHAEQAWHWSCETHAEQVWHWPCETHADDDASYAWLCTFFNGNQGSNVQGSEACAVAVCRIPIGGRDE